MAKYYIRTETGIGEDIVISEKEVADLKTAELDRKAGEKIHICYHDSPNPLPCKLI